MIRDDVRACWNLQLARRFFPVYRGTIGSNLLDDYRKEDGVKKFIVEREIPKVGTLEWGQLREAAAKVNRVLHQLGPDIQWVESYVAGDKTFCVFLAKDEALIHRHAELAGFPATKVTEISKMIDPTTAT